MKKGTHGILKKTLYKVIEEDYLCNTNIFIYKEVAERSKAIDCKSIELCSTLVRTQLSLIFVINMRVISSMAEHFVYTERVGGSSPLSLKNIYVFYVFNDKSFLYHNFDIDLIIRMSFIFIF